MIRLNEDRSGLGYVLLTGATGLLGRFLLKDLLLAGIPVAALVRSTSRQSAADRIEAIVQTWETRLQRSLTRPRVISGDLSDAQLGISLEDGEWLRAHCHSVLHNAASLSFISGPRHAEPWKTNLTGTQNLVEFCRDMGIREFHQVSTAYVCGGRQGVILEQELDENQQFSNDYEASKFEAERMVQQADCFDSVTVYRPSIIVGDSETGFTTTFHGFYAALQLCHTLAQGLEQIFGEQQPSLRINLDGTERKNLVPVDWVSAVICHIIRDHALHNSSYHLTSTSPVTMATIHNIIDVCCNSLKISRLIGATTVIENPNDLEKLFYENMQVYSSYWKNDPEFDSSNTRRAAPHLSCPVIDEDCLLMLGKAAIEQNFRWRDQPGKPLKIANN